MIPGLLMLAGTALIALRARKAHEDAEALAHVRVGDLLKVRSTKLVTEPAEARVKRITQGVLGPTYEVVVERLPNGDPSPDKGRTLEISPSHVVGVTHEARA